MQTKGDVAKICGVWFSECERGAASTDARVSWALTPSRMKLGNYLRPGGGLYERLTWANLVTHAGTRTHMHKHTHAHKASSLSIRQLEVTLNSQHTPTTRS